MRPKNPKKLEWSRKQTFSGVGTWKSFHAPLSRPRTRKSMAFSNIEPAPMSLHLGSYGYSLFKSNNHQAQSVRNGIPLSTFTLDETIRMHGNQTLPHGPHNGLRMEESECWIPCMHHLHSSYGWDFREERNDRTRWGPFIELVNTINSQELVKDAKQHPPHRLQRKKHFWTSNPPLFRNSKFYRHWSDHSSFVIILPPILRA